MDSIKRRNLIEELIAMLKDEYHKKNEHIETILKEKISPVEFCYGVKDLDQLKKNRDRLVEMVVVVEKLRTFLEDWYLTVGKR